MRLCSVSAVKPTGHRIFRRLWRKMVRYGQCALKFTLCSLALAAVQAATSQSLDLVLFTEQKYQDMGARCLDGSPSGLYYNAGTRDDVFIIDMQGGGLCFTPKDCRNRAKTALGSSKYFPKKIRGPIVSDTASFHGSPSIRVPYCSGDLHSGQRKTKHLYTFNMYFSGHLTLQAVVDWALENTSIKKAKKILITGVSAGGISTIMHADYFQDAFPWAKVMAAPIAGWFISVWTYKLHRPPIGVSLEGAHLLWSGYSHANCKHINKGRCYLGESVHKTTKVPLFVIENAFDTNQIVDQNGMPMEDTPDTQSYATYFGSAMRKSVKKSMDDGDFSVFLTSCFEHGVEGRATVQNVTYHDALEKWFSEDDVKKNPIRLLDDECPLPTCNPTCHKWPWAHNNNDHHLII